MKKNLSIYSLSVVALMLSLYLLNGATTHSRAENEPLSKEFDESQHVKLSREDDDAFFKGSPYSGMSEWFIRGNEALALQSSFDVQVENVKVGNVEKDLIPVSFNLVIDNKTKSALYFYDFYSAKIDGVAIWDKTTYNQKIDPGSKSVIKVNGWIPSKNTIKAMTTADVFNSGNIDLKLVVSPNNVNTDSFFSQVFKTKGKAQLSADTAHMYLVEKNSSFVSDFN
jgi:hypothetical protein